HHDASRTEQPSGPWILRSLHHCGGKPPPTRRGATDGERFLSHLATEGQVSASTQRQALNALAFLYLATPHKIPGGRNHAGW
ncbi:MAG: phage integrase N-terminal SAM-like domain-containing protein, partial [Candidatus Tectomicrobia bacterium]|nr:phage integrase N-terminal SAM-like domain-containing protein [Candidatus Tectomicrobia bacterium]